MPSVRAHRVSFAFSDAVPVFSDVDFHVSPGWTGLVGANGAGKSTLLRLLSGELTDGDSIRVDVNDERDKLNVTTRKAA